MRRIARVSTPLAGAAAAVRPARTCASRAAAAAAARASGGRATPVRLFGTSFVQRQTQHTQQGGDELPAEAAQPPPPTPTPTPQSRGGGGGGVLRIPRGYETAPRPDRITDSAYVPAETGDGLEAVGGLAGWWEDDRHWDAALAPRGFAAPQRVTDPAVLEVLARRAVVEALAVRAAAAAARREDSDVDDFLTAAWPRGGGADALRAALALDLAVAADGTAVVQGDAAGLVARLAAAEDAAADADADAEEQPPYIGAEEARELVASWDASWKDIRLDDPRVKFAITKRILQLTGHLLPDAQLASAHTVGKLLGVLVRPPRPPRLAEELAADGQLASLPNVAVYGRRVTPIDKHKMVGRWKVIVHELEKRGLPVTGTGKYGKSVERKWSYW